MIRYFSLKLDAELIRWGCRMKYTRYNLKTKHKKNNNNFMFYLAITLLLALLLGTVINRVFKNSGALWFDKDIGTEENGQAVSDKTSDKTSDETINKKEDVSKDEGSDKAVKDSSDKDSESVKVGDINSYYILQCGAFKVESNAKAVASKISGTMTPFIVNDGSLNKVYAGIYSEDEVEAAEGSIKDKGISDSRIIVNVETKDLSSVQMTEGVSALLQIVGKFTDVSVKSVKASDIKTWCSSLKPIDESMSDYESATAVKEYISKLPDEIKKDDGSKILTDVYNIIIKYKK